MQISLLMLPEIFLLSFFAELDLTTQDEMLLSVLLVSAQLVVEAAWNKKRPPFVQHW